MEGLVYFAKPSIAVIILWSANSKASLRLQAMPLWLGEYCAPALSLWYVVVYLLVSIQKNPIRSVSQVYDHSHRLEWIEDYLEVIGNHTAIISLHRYLRLPAAERDRASFVEILINGRKARTFSYCDHHRQNNSLCCDPSCVAALLCCFDGMRSVGRCKSSAQQQ